MPRSFVLPSNIELEHANLLLDWNADCCRVLSIRFTELRDKFPTTIRVERGALVTVTDRLVTRVCIV